MTVQVLLFSFFLVIRLLIETYLLYFLYLSSKWVSKKPNGALFDSFRNHAAMETSAQILHQRQTSRI